MVLSSDGHFALSGSWDKTLRLWDLSTGKTTRRFEDHSKVRQAGVKGTVLLLVTKFLASCLNHFDTEPTQSVCPVGT